MTTAELAHPVPSFIDALVDVCTHSETPQPAFRLARAAAAATGLPRIRHALHILRTRHPPAIPFIAENTPAHAQLVHMITDPHRVYAAPKDKAAVIVATHSLCNHPNFRDDFINSAGLFALCRLLNPVHTPDDNDTPDGNDAPDGNDTPDGNDAPDGNAARTYPPSTDSDTSSLDSPLAIHRAVWNAAIRTIAKLMVCSVAACAQSIETGALSLLAHAAKPMQPMDIRLRAAAGLAAIAAWSGPRRAVEIVETEGVLLSMTAILTEHDERIPGDLRSATIDALVVMSYRRHARRVLQKHGCEDKIKAAARHAGISGDYTAAAKSTVAAGHITGRSIDEYGFFVEAAPDSSHDEKRDSFHASPDRPAQPLGTPDTGLRKQHTGLHQIQRQLLQEPYTSMDDLNVLEEIVHEEAGVLSSSPRDRHHLRRAARMHGMSADEIEFMSILEDDEQARQNDDDPAGDNQQATAPTVKSSAEKLPSSQRLALQPSIFAEGRENARNSGQSYSPPVDFSKSDRPGSGLSATLTELVEQAGSSSPRRSSNFMSLQDPDFDRNFEEGEDADTASNTTGASSKSKMVSPLLMFSSATKKAAEKGGNGVMLRKTDSQLSRETEHERFWKEVIQNRPEMLRRERGKASRVVAYRELALVPVPPQIRRKLWPTLLDTASLREARPDLYKKLCRAADQGSLPDDVEHTIEADVTRTMPLHSLFWAGGAQVGVKSLRSILRAYARYVPEVGYCQGMSSIAAVFLMNATDEEEAFLMMAQFMTRFQYKKVFAPGFPLMLQWVSELKPLVAHYMPELNAQLERENVPLEIYADKWLITALSHNFPHRYLLRVWDLMFLGGSPKIILKACLAVLKKCEPLLMGMDFETMMPFLQRRFAEPEAGVLDAKDPEPFITLTREFRFMADIPKSQLRTSNQVQGPAQPSQTKERERRRISCLPCFRGSATVE